MKYVVDTHSLLYLIYDPQSLGLKAKRVFGDDASQLLIPTMALLECQYLIEIGKIEGQIADIMHYIRRKDGMEIVGYQEEQLMESLVLQGTRDPFDRIILATALCWKIPILTKDRWMKDHYPHTLW